MRIGVSQINTKAGDLASTAERMASISQVAAARGVDLLVFPVAALTGPVVVDYSEQDAFLLDVVDVLSDLAGRVSCDCLVPVVVPVSDTPVIEAVLLRDGKATPLRFGSWARKGLDSRLDPTPSADGDLTSLGAGGSRVGLAFSYEDMDAWCEKAGEVDAILFLASYGYAVDDPSSALGAALEEGRFLDDAAESHSWIVGAASLGGYGTQVFCGSSFVLSPEGGLAGVSPAFEEDLLVADVGRDALLEPDAELPKELYDERYLLWQSLVLGIHDYVTKLGQTDVVVPLDGSLASMLLAVVATDALGPTHVHTLLCTDDDHPRLADSSRLAHALRVDARPLGGEVPRDAMERRDVVEVRLRALAREVGGVVLSAADKTALALEAATHCPSLAWLAPLGDVYRIDVLDVARLRNTISSVIPNLKVCAQDVPDVGIEVPAWTLEGTLEHMDASLATHIEGERTLAETASAVGDEQVALAVIRALRAGEELRTSRPPCLMMTTRTLSDARMPLGFAWRNERLTTSAQEGAGALEGMLRQALSPQLSSAHAGGIRAEAGARPESYESAIRDALELLHDLSMGSNQEWLGPFSEN